MVTTVFLLIACILFIVAAVISVPTWNRLIAAGLACMTIGMGALSIAGVG